jgi:hypothetical protein
MGMWGGNAVNLVDPLGLYGCPDCHAQDIQNALDAFDNMFNKANAPEPPVPDATFDDTSRTGTRIWKKPGTFDDANNDFDSSGATDVQDKGKGVRVGKLPNGDKIIVRPNSTDGEPTIEIQRPDGKKSKDKVRYCS